MRKEGAFRAADKTVLDAGIHAARSLAQSADGVLSAYERLLRQVQRQTNLLRPSGRPSASCNPVNAALLALSLHHEDWLRPVELWRPLTRSAWHVFPRWAPTCSPGIRCRIS